MYLVGVNCGHQGFIIVHFPVLLFFSADGGICSAITPEDFEKAFEGFTPAALRGVSLHTAGELGWSDVGGLSGVKAALMETLLWPTKVNPCPLRHLTVKKYLSIVKEKKGLSHNSPGRCADSAFFLRFSLYFTLI